MAVKKEVKALRGCGYRKIGALYLMGELLLPKGCDRLPYELEICPCCGGGFKFTRGIVKTNEKLLFKDSHAALECECDPGCPICQPADQTAAIMWVGKQYYSPKSFLEEGRKQGVSKRIGRMPGFIELDKTWVYLAHMDGTKNQFGETVPAIFGAFKPTHYEKIMTQELLDKRLANNPDYIAKLEADDITIVLVDPNDEDHDPDKKYTPPSEEKKGLGDLDEIFEELPDGITFDLTGKK